MSDIMVSIFKFEMNIIEKDSSFKQHLGLLGAHRAHSLQDWHSRHQAEKDQPSQLTYQEQQHIQHHQHQQKTEEQKKHHSTPTGRKESQYHEGKATIRMVIKEEEVSSMTLEDREVNTQIFEIIIQEHPENSRYIMSDNDMRINFMNYSIASEFIMNIDVDIMIDNMQDSFTEELNIKLKNILEKITQADFDIALLIKSCGEVHHINLILFVGFANIIDQKQHSKSCRNNFDIIRQRYFIKSWHLRMHNNIEKDIMKVDINMGILNILGHFAQRGHLSPI